MRYDFGKVYQELESLKTSLSQMCVAMYCLLQHSLK